MALKPELEALLATIEDEKDRAEARKLMEKYPTNFADGYLRQADYDRNMNAAKEARAKEQAEVETYKANSKKWQDWADRNVPKHEQLTTEYAKVQTERDALKVQVEKAAAAASGGGGGNGGGGGEVDPEKLMARVNAELATRGYLTQAETAKIVGEEARKIAAEERKAFFDQTLPNTMSYIFRMNDLAADHKTEFNERFDRAAFAKFQVDSKVDDVDKAYELYVAEKRKDAWKKSETERITRDVSSRQGVPGTGASPAPELGPVQVNRLKKMPDLPDNAVIGDNSAAMAAAAELRAENKL